MLPDKSSVRPPVHSSDDRGGPSVEVGSMAIGESSVRESVDSSRPVFPLEETADEIDDDELLCRPCEGEFIAEGEEEQAAAPDCLPSVYQPTRSEYLDHCVTHFPFRVWCRHCLEGRGRELGHSNLKGDKDSRACPVVSFDYCFLGDV